MTDLTPTWSRYRNLAKILKEILKISLLVMELIKRILELLK